MRLFSYNTGQAPNGEARVDRLGFVVDQQHYDMQDTNPELPDRMIGLLEGGGTMMALAKETATRVGAGDIAAQPLSGIRLAPPLAKPTSLRDAYAFRQHVETSRRNRGVPMIPEFDRFPVFYFSNHQAICGPGEIHCMPEHFDRLDFELEVAVVLNKKGRNIKAGHADAYIAGYMVMNDLSARRLQMEEMKLNLGPAKGKDFATALGPYLVTPDELQAFKRAPKDGHIGDAYNLGMRCSVNGKQVSEGNLADMDWTFAEIIERISYGVDVFPGDVIGSGTVGTGCFLELNGTARLADPNHRDQWLQPGDTVAMEVDGLGQLSNTVQLEIVP